MNLIQVSSAEQIASARMLFEEYASALGIDLCFQGFSEELADLPGKYAPPSGRLFLAVDNSDEVAGCIAVRQLDGEICEMKRLYVRDAFRGKGVGRELAEHLIQAARELGYRRMRLDTLPGKMDPAISLYRSLGFEEVEPYYVNPVAGVLFFELKL